MKIASWKLRWGLVALLCILPGLRAGTKEAAKAAEALALATTLENAFTAVVDKAKPAVVVISNKQVGAQMQMQNIPPELRRFFGIPGQPPSQRGGRNPGQREEQRPRVVGKGSGIIIRENGYVVTNYHVIKDNVDLEVRLADGRIFDSERDKKEVEVVGVDKETDLAVLRIGGGKLNNLPTLPFADSDKIRVGDWAIAIGAPFDLDYSVTIGHVSQKGRHDVGMTTFENYIQTDASINPGNSGGPLLNIRGDLIGLNEFIVSRSGGSVGLGFAIASNLIQQVCDDLIEHGEVLRPFLGIQMDMLTDALKKSFGVQWGVLVSEALPGEPAEKAGIRAGDIIVNIGDKEVRTPHDLLFAVLAYAPGDKIRIGLIRNGKKMTVDVVARRRGGKDYISRSVGGRQGLLDKVGIAIDQTEDGLFVSAVVSGSPADRAGMQRDDRIIEVNRKPVKSVDDVLKAIRHSKDNVLVFYVDRRGLKRYIGVELDDAPDGGGK